MEKIASFTVDHLRLVPGVYVSRVDQVAGNPITTFDLRMTRPNKEPVMNILPQHSYAIMQNMPTKRSTSDQWDAVPDSI